MVERTCAPLSFVTVAGPTSALRLLRLPHWEVRLGEGPICRPTDDAVLFSSLDAIMLGFAVLLLAVCNSDMENLFS